MDPYYLLILLTFIVILSYSYDLVAIRFRLPSVLLLLVTGIALRLGADYFQIQAPNTQKILELFGIIGLILIVLEGSLDLKLSRERIPLIRNSFFTALGTLLVTSFAVATLLYLALNVSFRFALINAIPVGVISSAIAIPSVANLQKDKKEFIVYESTFSDILGIMLFNFVIQNEDFGFESVFLFSTSLLVIMAISVVCVVVLIFFIERIKHHTKFFLILSILMLVYALGKMFHLSSLVMVLALGIALNNTELFIQGKMLRFFSIGRIKKELLLVKIMTAESAFLIRTFFFVLFGFSIALREFEDLTVWSIGVAIFTIILVVRYLYLHFIARVEVLPALFVAPRGLITILLFYSIPKAYVIPGFTHAILLLVVILTALLMLVGLQMREARS